MGAVALTVIIVCLAPQFIQDWSVLVGRIVGASLLIGLGSACYVAFILLENEELSQTVEQASNGREFDNPDSV